MRISIILIFSFLMTFLNAETLTKIEKKELFKNCILYEKGKQIKVNKKFNYSKVTHIECSNKKLKEIPLGLYKLKNLVYIDLSNNKIKNISNDLLSKNLEYLNIYNNDLRVIPKKKNNIKTFIVTKKDNTIYNNKELKNLSPSEVEKYTILLKKYKEITWYDLDYYNSNLNLSDKPAKLALKTLKVKKLLKLQSINPHKQSFLYRKYSKVCNYKIRRYYDSAYARLDKNETQAFGKLLYDRKKYSQKKYEYYVQKYRNLSNSQLSYQLRTQKCIQDISIYKAITTLLK